MSSTAIVRPHITPELRQAYQAVSDQSLINHLRAKGLIVVLKNAKNRHFVVTGKVREVSFYATSGTVNAAPHHGMGSVNIKGMMPDRAIERVAAVANFGH